MTPAESVPPVRVVTRTQGVYPRRLIERLGSAAPATLVMRGDPALLEAASDAVFCSVSPPPALVLQAIDLAEEIAGLGRPCVGGYQSPTERLILEALLRGDCPVVWCVARAIGAWKPRGEIARAERQGRLLVLSGVERPRRMDATLAAARNRMAAALAPRVAVVHATPGGRLSWLVEEVLGWGIPVRCLEHAANEDLILRGAVPCRAPAT